MKSLLRIALLSWAVFLVGAGAWILTQTSVAHIKTVAIEMDSKSSEQFMFQRIHASLVPQMKKYLDRPFWDVRLKDVYDEVQSDQRVRSVQIQREFPHTIRVTVTPHEPLLGYLDERGRVHPVARDATLLPPLTLKDAPNYPLLRGKDFVQNAELRAKAIELLNSIPSAGHFRQAAVSEITHVKSEGFKLFLLDHFTEVKMGESDFNLKTSRVEKVLSYLHNRNIKGRVIDARFSKKVVVRVRNTP